MMHSSLLLGAVVVAGLWRLTWAPRCSPLTLFVAPPLLLLSTVLAIVVMGSSGQMWGWPTGWAGYIPALVVMGVALLSALWQWLAGWWAVRRLLAIATLETVAAEPVYVVAHPAVFAAQIGIIYPRLMLTTGLQHMLSPAQQAAVIWHERAHRYYHDSLLFFALGWLRWWTLSAAPYRSPLVRRCCCGANCGLIAGPLSMLSHCSSPKHWLQLSGRRLPRRTVLFFTVPLLLMAPVSAPVLKLCLIPSQPPTPTPP
ncbi:MAG: hypothetical protein HC926_00215 [Synechococcaceae cyanobacterium SM2_3_60]|nr:hypothetical protein [Synechococcaceae cyanobacterium SM2_3_60]